MSPRKPRKADEPTPGAGNGQGKRPARQRRSEGNRRAATSTLEATVSLREAAGGPVPGSPDDLHARIAECAYGLYERRGRQQGFELDDWLEAERRVRGTQIKQQVGS